jgi:hypothetical protein
LFDRYKQTLEAGKVDARIKAESASTVETEKSVVETPAECGAHEAWQSPKSLTDDFQKP